MSANMEDNMEVDEENMQIDEDPTVGELPMSTDEDSVQDAGAAMKVVDDAMASDSPDVDIALGPRAGSEGPTEMESDTIADEVSENPSVKTPEKTAENPTEESSDPHDNISFIESN
uniref:Polycystic kidney disease protein 1-like 3 n=1 Tax=Lygus hesperus TaxID=30085 RepID=A0A0A9Z000_LYGHE